MLPVLLCVVWGVFSYPPPVLVKEPIQIIKNITKSYIVENHMKYSNHTKFHKIPMIAHVTRFHERNSITLPIFAHLFDAIAFDYITIRTINDITNVIDQNPYKSLSLPTKKLAILKTDADFLGFSMDLFGKIKEQLKGYDGILFDSSISKEFTLQTIDLLPKTFLKYKLVSLGEEVTPYQSFCDAVFIDTQFYDKSAVSYQPLQPVPWIEEQISKHFGLNKEKVGFVVDFEGKVFCKHSTTHFHNLPYLRMVKKMNITITYHPASHEHSVEAPYVSERYMDDYCTTNYPTPFSINEKLLLADRYNATVLFHDFGAALDYFFDVL